MAEIFTADAIMSWFTINIISAFLLPPLCLLLLLALGIFLLFCRSSFAKPLLITTFCLLWLASTPYFAEGALHLLEARTAALTNRQTANAIVILGGGSYSRAPEYGGKDTISEETLVRLRYGAKLQRETGKPILVTGGNPLNNNLTEARQMRSSLEQDFHAQVRWIEDMSGNTFENARFSFNILKKDGVKKIYLVTHAWHMPRSAETFRRAGFEVIEAPTAFTTRYRIDLLAFLPNAQSMQYSRFFAHEIIGLYWYRVKLEMSNI